MSNQINDYYKPNIKVIGLGGGGGNVINRMIELNVQGVEYIIANTDIQVLDTIDAPTKIQLGPKLTRGLGAGGDPEVGRESALESRSAIKEALQGADMVFLAAGMGGGTGTGAIGVAGEISRELGAVTISVVTTPFKFEGSTRDNNAQIGLNWLYPHTDTLITIPNDKLLTEEFKHLPVEMTFRLADDVLVQAVQGITELATRAGMMNVDFSHVQNMMKQGGYARMSIGLGSGESRAKDALGKALKHPLLDDIPLANATGIITNFTGNQLEMMDITYALELVNEHARPETDIVMGINEDENMDDRAQAILIVTGITAQPLNEAIEEINDRTLYLSGTAETKPVDIEPKELDQIARAKFYKIQPVPQPATGQHPNDINLPAFMRRKERFSQVTKGEQS